MESFSGKDQKKLCYAVIIVLLVLIVLHLRKMSMDKEHLVNTLGQPMGSLLATAQVGASGPTIRSASEFTGTNQLNSAPSNADIANVTEGQLSGTSLSDPSYLNAFDRASSGSEYEREYESLVNSRGMPDFWEVGNELAAYQKSQAPGLRRAAGVEHMDNPVQDIIQQQVMAQERGKVWA